MNTVTREELQNAIELALARADPTAQVAKSVVNRLRGAATYATEFQIGTYCDCPLSLAGITRDDAEIIGHQLDDIDADRFVMRFAEEFDTYINERVPDRIGTQIGVTA